MSLPTIYELALELARKDGWRNVTRTPLFRLAKERGLVSKGTTEPTWCKNYLRGSNSMSCLRARLRQEPGVPDGVPQGERSPAWKDVNRELILDKAFDLAVSRGRLIIPRADIAEAAGVSPATVSGMWGSMQKLRDAVIERAREKGAQRLVDQADALGLT